MAKEDIIKQVCEKTGIPANICEKIIEAFEGQIGDTLLNTLKGIKNNRSDILAQISSKTGFAVEDCEKVLDVFEELSSRFSSKLKIFQ